MYIYFTSFNFIIIYICITFYNIILLCVLFKTILFSSLNQAHNTLSSNLSSKKKTKITFKLSYIMIKKSIIRPQYYNINSKLTQQNIVRQTYTSELFK